MFRKILPFLLAFIGIAGGVGAGLLMEQESVEPTEPKTSVDTEVQDPDATEHGGNSEKSDGREYVRLNNQFLVPVVTGSQVEALVLLSLSVETTSAGSQSVYKLEPKLRDAFLQELFEHANRGGFAGQFTSAGKLDVLRTALTEVARAIVGKSVSGVLITDIARQDI